MNLSLERLVSDFTSAIEIVDAAEPQAQSARSKKKYQPGIGPHTETQTVDMVAQALRENYGDRYRGKLETDIPYVENPRQKCDLCWGSNEPWDWAIEVKMLRMLGDNGKPNDNMLMHILSPYPRHRSALTDCEKLSESRLGKKCAVLIYAYESERYPIITAIDAFEILAKERVQLGSRISEDFEGLVHPVHSEGSVFAWEIALK